MASQVAKVRRETLKACMTCPLCNKLLREATTISECLHTFCRKCIHGKFTNEEVDYCPVCSIDLGCVPVEKLRPDHNLQDVRAKIFPSKRRRVNAPEVVPSTSLPVRRKERSLSSLVVSTPRVSTQTSLTGRRTKAVARKAASLRGPSFPIKAPIKKEEDPVEDHPESLSSPETLNKIAQNKRQNSSTAEPSNYHTPDQETGNGAELWAGKVDLWKPLNCLVEAANRTKSFNSHGSVVKSEPPHVLDSEAGTNKTKFKRHRRKLKIQDDKNGTTPTPPGMVKPRKMHKIVRKRAAASRNLGTSPQAVLDAAGAKRDRKFSPIWFSLMASKDQEGNAPLPQISAYYLRIKDSNVPVSFIQKYLVKKLDLTSEVEVQIMCQGQPVVPTLQLHSLVDLWLQMASTSQRVPASLGTSGKEFVMVLAYARKESQPRGQKAPATVPSHTISMLTSVPRNRPPNTGSASFPHQRPTVSNYECFETNVANLKVKLDELTFVAPIMERIVASVENFFSQHGQTQTVDHNDGQFEPPSHGPIEDPKVDPTPAEEHDGEKTQEKGMQKKYVKKNKKPIGC